MLRWFSFENSILDEKIIVKLIYGESKYAPNIQMLNIMSNFDVEKFELYIYKAMEVLLSVRIIEFINSFNILKAIRL